MLLPVAMFGLGPLGQRVALELEQRRLGRIVAAFDPGPELVGRPLAELVPGADPDVRIATVPGEFDGWERVRCALVTTTSDLELCMETFRVLLDRGCNVVSTCEELSWPWLRHPILAAELQERAVRGRARILGTGVNPGFLMDALPVALSTACKRVDRVRIERVQDAAVRRLPFQRKIGAGKSLREFEQRVADGSLRHVGLGESLHFVAHYLGWNLERWDESIEPVLAERELASDLGPVPAGHVRGVRQVARGDVAGETVLELVFQAALGEPEPHDSIRIEGDPPLELRIAGGVHGDTATCAIVLNAIRPLLTAEPGLHTMASVPLTGCATSLSG